MPLLRVAVGISSGVDSAVSALILSKMRRRFEVIGCFMRNWDTADETGREDAKLNISCSVFVMLM